jgi:hypothetical protein
MENTTQKALRPRIERTYSSLVETSYHIKHDIPNRPYDCIIDKLPVASGDRVALLE